MSKKLDAMYIGGAVTCCRCILKSTFQDIFRSEDTFVKLNHDPKCRRDDKKVMFCTVLSRKPPMEWPV